MNESSDHRRYAMHAQHRFRDTRGFRGNESDYQTNRSRARGLATILGHATTNGHLPGSETEL